MYAGHSCRSLALSVLNRRMHLSDLLVGRRPLLPLCGTPIAMDSHCLPRACANPLRSENWEAIAVAELESELNLDPNLALKNTLLYRMPINGSHYPLTDCVNPLGSEKQEAIAVSESDSESDPDPNPALKNALLYRMLTKDFYYLPTELVNPLGSEKREMIAVGESESKPEAKSDLVIPTKDSQYPPTECATLLGSEKQEVIVVSGLESKSNLALKKALPCRMASKDLNYSLSEHTNPHGREKQEMIAVSESELNSKSEFESDPALKNAFLHIMPTKDSHYPLTEHVNPLGSEKRGMIAVGGFESKSKFDSELALKNTLLCRIATEDLHYLPRECTKLPGSVKWIKHSKQTHAAIVNGFDSESKYESDPALRNALLCRMPAKGSHHLPRKCVNPLGSVKRIHTRLESDVSTFNLVLSTSAHLGSLKHTKQTHALIAAGFEYESESNLASKNALLHMYAECSCPSLARAVFDRMCWRNTTSWNTMIATYAHNDDGEEALRLFCRMESEGVPPNKATYLLTLDACAVATSLETGRTLHERITQHGLESDSTLGTALINMYGKCGSPKDAFLAFNKISQPNVISWTAMIATYAQNGQAKEALELFELMESKGMRPNRVTYLCIIYACAGLRSLANGRVVHKCIVRDGFQSNVGIENALVSMYGKCGSLIDARVVFDNMNYKNVISWTAMITSYAQNGYGKEALKLFGVMDIKPNRVTFLSVLDTCADVASLANSRAIHLRIIASGFESDVTLGNALIHMYGKFGSLVDAKAVFDGMSSPNVVSWNAMLAAYVQSGQGMEAFELYRRMDAEGRVKPDRITILGVLDACSSMALLQHGRAIHEKIIGNRFELDITIGTALIHMYGKCGSPNDALAVFNRMSHWNAICWTAIIVAYAENGNGQGALKLFQGMESVGIKTDSITFLSILNACSHSGLLDEGRHYLMTMRDHYCLPLSMEHFVCMVDLLGRLGRLDEAEDMINNMPAKSMYVEWMTLLNAYRMHGYVEHGSSIVRNLFKVDSKNSSSLALLSCGTMQQTSRKLWRRITS